MARRSLGDHEAGDALHRLRLDQVGADWFATPPPHPRRMWLPANFVMHDKHVSSLNRDFGDERR
jgi:hypothetical protein